MAWLMWPGRPLNRHAMVPGSPPWIPSYSLGYREFTTDRAYKGDAILPSSTSGLTWARASDETVPDAAGLLSTVSADVPARSDLGLQIFEARTNLALHSGAPSSWANSLVAVASSAVIAPDGTAAALVVPSGDYGAHLSSITTGSGTGTNQTISGYFRAGGQRYLQFAATDGVTSGAGIVCDTVAGAIVGDVLVGSGWSVTASGTQTIGAGWFRFWATINGTVNSSNNVFLIYTNSASLDWTGTPYAGNGTDGIYPFGVQVEAGSFPTPYIPTTTAAASRAADAGSDTVPAAATRCVLTYADGSTGISTGLTPGGTFGLPNNPAGTNLVSMDYRP